MTPRRIYFRAAMIAALLFLIVRVHAETTHTVAPGDTLGSISKRYFGNLSGYRRIAELNGMVEPYRMEIGQKLLIPGPESGAESKNSDSAIPSHAALTPRHSPTSAYSVAPRPMNFAKPDSSTPPVKSFMPEISESKAPVKSINPVTDEIAAHELMLVDFLGRVKIINKTSAGASNTLGRGARLKSGDSIRTDQGSYALLAGANSERFSLGAFTTVTMQELSTTSSERLIIVRMDQGQLAFSAPETRILSRYVFKLPTGSVITRYGKLAIAVNLPEFSSVSVFEGKTLAQIPMGSVELAAGAGAVLRITEPPPAPTPLPPRPGLSIETSATTLILAGAARPEQTITFDVFADADYAKLIASKSVPTDASGVALSRLILPPSLLWIRARTLAANNLTSEPSFAGPILLTAR